jgi:hypothetical protein
MRIDMDEPKTFRQTHFDAISRGESIYITLAEETGNNPVVAIKALSTILSASWRNREQFLADLGNNDHLALMEARSHFGLPPLE